MSEDNLGTLIYKLFDPEEKLKRRKKELDKEERIAILENEVLEKENRIKAERQKLKEKKDAE